MDLLKIRGTQSHFTSDGIQKPLHHGNDKIKRNNRKHLLSAKPNQHVHGVIALHFTFFPSNNLILYKADVSLGGKGNSLVSACLFCRESCKHTALLLTHSPFLPGE